MEALELPATCGCRVGGAVSFPIAIAVSPEWLMESFDVLGERLVREWNEYDVQEYTDADTYLGTLVPMGLMRALSLAAGVVWMVRERPPVDDDVFAAAISALEGHLRRIWAEVGGRPDVACPLQFLAGRTRFLMDRLPLAGTAGVGEYDAARNPTVVFVSQAGFTWLVVNAVAEHGHRHGEYRYTAPPGRAANPVDYTARREAIVEFARLTEAVPYTMEKDAEFYRYRTMVVAAARRATPCNDTPSPY